MSTADDFFSGGTTSAKFDTVGKTVAGRIARVGEPMQQRDFTTKQPKSWDDGRPMMQLPVDVQTDERSTDVVNDDGVRTLYVRGELQKAIRTAVRQAGAPGLRVGGQLSVTYTGDGVPSQRGMSGAKLYTASYTPPSAADGFLGGAETSAAPPAAVPAQATGSGQPPAGAASSPAAAAALAALSPQERDALFAQLGGQQAAPPF